MGARASGFRRGAGQGGPRHHCGRDFRPDDDRGNGARRGRARCGSSEEEGCRGRGAGGRHGGGAYRCWRRRRTDARRPSACTDGGTGRAGGPPHLTSGFLMSPPPAPVTAGKIMDKLVSLTKRRGFVFQSSEIYGGLGSVRDYGPLGVELKKNIKERWWRAMGPARDDNKGLEAARPNH